MQELTYVNLVGEELVFGGSRPLILAGIKGTEAAGVSRKTLKGSMQDGDRTVSLKRDARKVDITFNLMSDNRTAFYRTRARLSTALSAGNGFDRKTGSRAKIIYRNDFGKWWTWAVPGKMPQWPKRIQDIHPNIKMSFDCDSAFWFSMDENTADFSVSNGGFRFPFQLPLRFGSRRLETRVFNYGFAPAPVKITAYGEGERPTLLNRTTGARISFVEPLPHGAVLEINTDPEDLYVMVDEHDGEGWKNAYGYLDAATPISEFNLLPGENIIVYKSSDASTKTTITMTWIDLFEGV